MPFFRTHGKTPLAGWPAPYIFFVGIISGWGLLLSGCWGPRSEPSARVGQFFVAKSGGRPVDVQLPSGPYAWGLPDRKVYSFYACLKDSRRQQPLLGLRLAVVKREGKVEVEVAKDLTTDRNGCLTWTEDYHFNFFSRPGYLREERLLRDHHGQWGEASVAFALNPLIALRGGSSTQEVVSLLETTVATVAPRDFASESATGAPHRLWMNDVGLFVRFVGEAVASAADRGYGGVDMEVDLEMKPVVLLPDMHGLESPYPIKRGNFRVTAYLVAEGAGTCRCERWILTPGLAPVNAQVLPADGVLRGPLKARLSEWVARGQVNLVLRVEPIGAPSPALIPFEGVFSVGPIDKLEGSKRLALAPPSIHQGSSFSLASYLDGVKNRQQLADVERRFLLEPFIFGTMEVRFQTIKPGETATTRTVIFRVKTCVTETLTGRRVVREAFRIKRVPYARLLPQENLGPDIIRETDDEGCLTWMDEYRHQYYQPEQYVFPKAEITHLGQEKRAEDIGVEAKPFRKELTMVINPWDEKWTFGADQRALLPEYVEAIQVREKVKSRFRLFDYGYQTIRFLYETDKFMNLEVKKTVLLRLSPRAIRYSSIVAGRRATEPLRDGIYLMKVAMQKNYLDPAAKGVSIVRGPNGNELQGTDAEEVQTSQQPKIFFTKMGSRVKAREFISVVQKLVRVEAGEIVTPIELTVRDLRLMKIRALLFIELETIDEEKLLMANVYNEVTTQKIDEWLKKVEQVSPGEDLPEPSGCLIQNETSFREQLQAALKQLKERREAPAELRARLLEERNMVVEALVRSLRAEKANQVVATDNLGELRAKQRRGERLFAGRTLSDYYENLNICPDVIEKTLKELELNDFTVNPAAPVVDLNLLLDRSSGLEKRTFVGPITLYHNNNHANLRPTDSLDEIFCESGNDGCNQLDRNGDPHDNSDYEDSEWFGSIRHYVGYHVDDLIGRKIKADEHYKRVMEIESLLFNFVDFHRLRFVSLSDETLYRYVCPVTPDEIGEDVDWSDCLQAAPSSSIPKLLFLGRLNEGARRDSEMVSVYELADIVTTGRISEPSGRRFCALLARQYVEDNGSILQRPYGYAAELAQACAVALRSKATPLSLVRRYRVDRTGRYRFRGGKWMGLEVGSSFGVDHSSSFGFAAGLDLAGIASHIPVVGRFAKGIQIGWMRSDNRTRSDGIKVGARASLEAQMAGLELEILRHEKCLELRWSGEFIDNNEVGVAPLPGRGFFRREVDKTVAEQVVLPGFFICSGAVDTTPTTVPERYYYISQETPEGEMLDPGDLYNYPWLLTLRGIRDFRAFVHLINQDESSVMSFANPMAQDKVVTSAQWPIDKLSSVYRDVLPTFPGLYTVLEAAEDHQLDYPWSELGSKFLMTPTALVPRSAEVSD